MQVKCTYIFKTLDYDLIFLLQTETLAYSESAFNIFEHTIKWYVRLEVADKLRTWDKLIVISAVDWGLIEGVDYCSDKGHFSRIAMETMTTHRETLGVNFHPPPLFQWFSLSVSFCVCGGGGFRVSQPVADAAAGERKYVFACL